MAGSQGHDAYLRNALSKYQYPDLAKRDILQAFSNFKDLRPNVDSFVFNDGNRKELLCLEGTIPVTYRGTTYNIPVCLWLLETHPYNPPMVYVKPTATMQIKPGQHVDANGRVYLPYLHEWRHPQSDLFGLIQIMGIIFGENPPVFAKKTGGPPPRPGYPPGGLPYPLPGGGTPPYPMQNSSQTPYPPASTGASQPPYPSANSSGFMPMPSVGGPTNPPYPAYQPSYPPTSYPSAGAGSGGYPGGGYGGYPPQGSSYPATSSYPGSQGYQPSQPSFATPTTAAMQQSAAISDEQIRLSLVSAVEDKMRRRLKEIFAQAQAEMDALKKTQDDLNNGKTKLDDMISRLRAEQNEVGRSLEILTEKDNEIREALRKMESQNDLNIDDAVVTTAPLYKQLMNAFAEEQSIEDAIYYIGEALRKGVIDLDVFLKQVRELSRQQFMLRALIQKCRQKAGLPEIG
ncbi:tumor susceptibility gene 101 protein isoform X2 [Lingula anatina]|uniref:Tumor susceptibility gene 101 protein isoform X2 n=1 Tax=Lingula anatina TaxID=7574 RepID=A0A1S3JUC6_LINAN|nr:tumor susceptibility gene 101 protein isoform X2 [Lingula anatina]|eukprot:XP_013413928.1 tumor susceptibility gene 101 protein isoform X2 [Lingula anatina]